MASKGSGGGGGGGGAGPGGGGVGRIRLGLGADYNSLFMEYVLSKKEESEKKFGTVRLAQIMRNFGNTVLLEIANKKNPFMIAVALTKNSTMKHEWNQLKALESSIMGLQSQLQPAINGTKLEVSDSELTFAIINKMIEILNENYNLFFPNKAVLAGDFYSQLLAEEVDRDRAKYFAHNFKMPPTPTHTPKGGRRRRHRTKRRKSRKN
jgi:hypothetical protein